MPRTQYKVLDADVQVLRELARRYLEACNSPRNEECRRLWYQHDLCQGERPLILTETDAGIEMVLGPLAYRCREPWAQAQERMMLDWLMHFEIIRDDFPLEPFVPLKWNLSVNNYGVASHLTSPQTDGSRGAYHIDAVITDLSTQFDRLKPRTFEVDREGSLEFKSLLESVYDGLLGVQMRLMPWWTMGLTMDAIHIIGLENLMMFMYDQPQWLHRLMAFLRDDARRLLDWMRAQDLLALNNLNDYTGSGSRGYTRDLPRADYAGRPRTQDRWVLLESQETVGVGPAQFAEFIFPYQRDLAGLFGKVYYGCCEPVHTRWHILKDLPNLSRVSISPWCDQEMMAEALGRKYVFSRKPKPTLVSTERFDEDVIRQDLRQTIAATRKHGCTVEILMKDVHTLAGQRHRLTRWVEIAREETERSR